MEPSKTVFSDSKLVDFRISEYIDLDLRAETNFLKSVFFLPVGIVSKAISVKFLRKNLNSDGCLLQRKFATSETENQPGGLPELLKISGFPEFPEIHPTLRHCISELKRS